jgi:glucose/arabinose dehydrogenase
LRRFTGALVLIILALLPGCSDDGTGTTSGPPVVTIQAPVEGATFRAGDVVTYAGSATYAGGATISAERLTWWIDLHHDDHAHPFVSPRSGFASGTVTIPTRTETDDNIWYRFYLQATDPQGETHTVHRDIFPEKSILTFRTEPEGLQITLDGAPRTTPFSVVGVVGIERDIGIVTPQSMGGESYTMESWSQGGEPSQTIVTPARDSTFVATFVVTETPNQPPTVNLTAPAPGSTLTVNTAVTVSADAADSDGTVTQVSFFANGQSIGTDATSPYSIQWTPSATGSQTLTATATDNAGALGHSSPVNVTVVAGAGSESPPSVQLTFPSDQSQGLTGALTLRATASDDVGVAGVQFQVDGENVGAEVTSAPYEVVLPATSAYASGVHVIRARARNTAGLLSTWSSATVTFGGNHALPAGFSMGRYGADLPGLATNLAFAPDGMLFVTLKNGSILIVRDGVLLQQPFAVIDVEDTGESGLLGLAFHPNFASNGWLYIHYITTAGGTPRHARIARLNASGNVASGPEEVLIALPEHQNSFHKGGEIQFGPDGRLYIAVGDDSRDHNSQSLNTTSGKMLRFNDDGTIPSDNPFFGSTSGMNRSIWALGLRNPFTFAFQPGTGRMFINDVGGGGWEEINEGVRGANYGWPNTEGPTTDPRFTSPIFAYRHSGALLTGGSIVGAAFYHPSVQQFPAAYAGQYFFGDYVSNWIHRLDHENGNVAYRFATVPGRVTGLTVGPDGALYVLLSQSFSSGWIERISYSP